MRFVTHAQCLICGKKYEKDAFDYVCPDHGNEGILDIQYNYSLISKLYSKSDLRKNKNLSIWRYKPLLPVGEDFKFPNLSVGYTPLIQLDRLADELGIKNFYLKDDGRLPTASFKDRASAIAVVKAREKKARVVTTASTGNAAAALSGLCAVTGQANVIFVPASAPQAKIAQLLIFGSKVVLVDGTYDDAFELCLKAANMYGWYNRNTGYNPFMSEGKKTCSFEISEQMSWQVPDAVFVSVGDGCIIGGIHKGFKDLESMGWIDKVPRLFGVQAEGSGYMYQAWKNGEDIINKAPIHAQTCADSISAGLPRDRIKAMNAVKDTGGAYVAVSDDAILKAIPDLARKTGVFAEPAGAATWAGVLKAADQRLIKSDDTVVMVNTGSGLKDIPAAMKAADMVGSDSYKIDPDVRELEKIVNQLNI